MPEATSRTAIRDDIEAIRELLSRSLHLQATGAEIERDIRDLERKRTDTTGDLLHYAAGTSTLTERQTAMAQERTDLTREQTRLSTRSTEMAQIRTDLARERTSLSGQRTDLAVIRSDMARARTNLANQRTDMAQARTHLAQRRTTFSQTRTTLARVRNELARARTHLALIRTGLALLALGVALFRLFGLSWWSLFDAGLVLGSLLIAAIGSRGYLRANTRIRGLESSIEAAALD